MDSVNTPNVNPTKVEEQKALIAQQQEDLNAEYTDERTITISLVHNYSNYRKANLATLGQRKEVIGSSINSCKRLSSNAGEVEAYFPALIGLSPNHPDFVSRVKAWLSNIQLIVNENDKTLDISFVYNHKSDYLKFKEREDAIDNAYAKVNRANLSEIKDAIKKRVDALHSLESEKYKVGHPVNLEDYLMYRHCLLFHDVAKDTALINSDPSLRFYIKDEAKEAEKQRKMTEERMKAMRNFIELGASEKKLDALYVVMIKSTDGNIADALLKDRSAKNQAIMDFVNNHPDKFNELYQDKNLATKALIEVLIIRGELIRAEYNQQISTAEGTFIGSNMKEAVAYFTNPNNKGVRDAYESKLKMF